MFSLLYPLAAVTGLALLIVSADSLIRASASLAAQYRIPPSIIGLTLIALGTSLPEIAVTMSATLTGTPEIAIGGILGSNIANICLCLGITALIFPIPINKWTLRMDFPTLALITLLTGVVLWDGVLSSLEGSVLLAALCVYLALLYRSSSKRNEEPVTEVKQRKIAVEILLIALNLVLVVVGSETAIFGAKATAEMFEVSPLIIGITLIAVGSSLPEIAVSLQGARRRQTDLVIANIIGSNIINLAAALGGAALVGELAVGPIIDRDIIALLLCTALFGALIYYKRSELGRWCGLLLIIYTVYIYLVVS